MLAVASEGGDGEVTLVDGDLLMGVADPEVDLPGPELDPTLVVGFAFNDTLLEFKTGRAGQRGWRRMPHIDREASPDPVVGSDRVVTLDERVEVALQRVDRSRARLAVEPVLHRAMKPFDLPASLGVIGPGVHMNDAERGDIVCEETAAVFDTNELNPVVRQDLRRHAPPARTVKNCLPGKL